MTTNEIPGIVDILNDSLMTQLQYTALLIFCSGEITRQILDKTTTINNPPSKIEYTKIDFNYLLFKVLKCLELIAYKVVDEDLYHIEKQKSGPQIKVYGLTLSNYESQRLGEYNQTKIKLLIEAIYQNLGVMLNCVKSSVEGGDLVLYAIKDGLYEHDHYVRRQIVGSISNCLKSKSDVITDTNPDGVRDMAESILRSILKLKSGEVILTEDQINILNTQLTNFIRDKMLEIIKSGPDNHYN
jgi:hypothetical protein